MPKGTFSFVSFPCLWDFLLPTFQYLPISLLCPNDDPVRVIRHSTSYYLIVLLRFALHRITSHHIVHMSLLAALGRMYLRTWTTACAYSHTQLLGSMVSVRLPSSGMPRVLQYLRTVGRQEENNYLAASANLLKPPANPMHSCLTPHEGAQDEQGSAVHDSVRTYACVYSMCGVRFAWMTALKEVYNHWHLTWHRVSITNQQ